MLNFVPEVAPIEWIPFNSILCTYKRKGSILVRLDIAKIAVVFYPPMSVPTDCSNESSRGEFHYDMQVLVSKALRSDVLMNCEDFKT